MLQKLSRKFKENPLIYRYICANITSAVENTHIVILVKEGTMNKDKKIDVTLHNNEAKYNMRYPTYLKACET